ncbi:NUDIX domain-containing protein [Mycobacteroides abscessus]|uniref:NUDIX domain-containing protein n=1 Tax=Mycobacteroides abscessus TaxID=36809 RepID=UPI0009A78584|nr:NUDIX hydrolase [Mycobacteroides abscessus]RRE00787.1 NUDIX hydrolase [Mycobacteroides abscessus subsp. massiliense]SKG41207.1 MutT/nudix family protein [Mycobacteroides abscessus subsp. massiliense]SKH68175.1 MutT/nudix family protein [Mycobacteroides abscessus subsp. massiliense]SKH78986.1 MutT/nudix family protein [Mycobacteroides abscessus subsp. massiliense]SKI51587.1 MutT/nudix family protein [Mycobacteroides abscessus subsp. massiliense]
MSDGTSGERERHEFVTLESEPVYMGGILALRRDRVAMPGGRSATREVVEHYGAVAVAAVDEAGRVALVYQYRHPLGHRLWELPAGLLDIAGEDSQRAAARELLEEAGIEAGTWRVLVDAAASPGFTDEVVRVFLATGLSHPGRGESHDEEADMTVHWVPLSEAVSMVMAGEVVNAIAVAGILATHVALGGHHTRPVDAPWPDRPTAFAERKAAT